MKSIAFTDKQEHVFNRFNALRRAYEDANGGGRVYNPDFLTVLMDAWEERQRKVKYRVKIPCYHYNTGSADNYSYVAKHDFDTKEQADAFAKKVNEQYEMHSKFEKHEIAFSVYNNWSEGLKHTGEMYEVEDGYVTGFAKVVEFIPEPEPENESK